LQEGITTNNKSIFLLSTAQQNARAEKSRRFTRIACSLILLVAAGSLFAQSEPVSTKLSQVDKSIQGVWSVIEVSFDKGATFESYDSDNLSSDLVTVYDRYAIDAHDGRRFDFEEIYHVQTDGGTNYSEIYYKNLTRMWRVSVQPGYILCQVFHIARHNTVEVDRMRIAITKPR
jgi:hypothetical protein